MADKLVEMVPEYKDDDPVLTREVWIVLLSEFLKEEWKRDPERFNQFDSDWLQKNDRELLRDVEAKQAEILNLGDARASITDVTAPTFCSGSIVSCGSNEHPTADEFNVPG